MSVSPGEAKRLSKTGTKKQRWLDGAYSAAIKKHPERKARFSTLSDEVIEPLYTADDLEGFDTDRHLGFPGEYPYARGVQPSMYRGRLWTMRQFAGFGSAENTNERFHYLLKHGVDGLSVAFDMPTLMGRDSDDPLSRGPALEHDLHLRLSHPRSGRDGAAGARVHAHRWARVREMGRGGRPGRRRFRPASFFLLRRSQRFLRGDREVPRGPADLGARDRTPLPPEE